MAIRHALCVFSISVKILGTINYLCIIHLSDSCGIRSACCHWQCVFCDLVIFFLYEIAWECLHIITCWRGFCRVCRRVSGYKACLLSCREMRHCFVGRALQMTVSVMHPTDLGTALIMFVPCFVHQGCNTDKWTVLFRAECKLKMPLRDSLSIKV